MSKANYVAGLRAVEQLMDSPGAEIRKIYTEYRTANPRVEALKVKAGKMGIELLQANRARLTQISGEGRHQGVVAEIQRSTQMDEAALRSLVEKRLTEDDAGPLLLLILDGVQDPHNLGACLRTAILQRQGSIVAQAGLDPVSAGQIDHRAVWNDHHGTAVHAA